MSVLKNKIAQNMIIDQNNNIQILEYRHILTAWKREVRMILFSYECSIPFN